VILAGALDTNILVRLMVEDDAVQADMAAKLLARHARRSEHLFVPVTVVLELEWVLRSAYQFNKRDVIEALSALLTTFELAFESEAALEQALAGYQDGNADFADYLHLALAQQEQALPFWTLDAKASKGVGAKLLTATPAPLKTPAARR
jgi:predicted nucleic-acid-binding protein